MVRSSYTVEKGCPLCKGDVRGNVRDNFFCKKCRLLYRKGHLRSWKFKRKHKGKREIVKVHFGNSYVRTARGKVYHVKGCIKLKEYPVQNLRLADPSKDSACDCVGGTHVRSSA
ncbi:hypothetical protein CMO92_03005 [Candidatus Woesearchaeota archaeon]|nr:hypothetical protein [Candidatus Woesearchaeota archaeon]